MIIKFFKNKNLDEEINLYTITGYGSIKNTTDSAYDLGSAQQRAEKMLKDKFIKKVDISHLGDIVWTRRNALTEEIMDVPWFLQQGDEGEPEFIGWAKSQDDMLDKLVDNRMSDFIYENTYIDELDEETYLYMKEQGYLSEDEIEELDKYFNVKEN